MKNKRIIAGLSLLTLTLLPSCSSDKYTPFSGEAVVSEDFPNAIVYLGALGKSYRATLPCCYFTFVKDVPYVSLKGYYSTFFTAAFTDGEPFYKVEGNKVTNVNNGASLVFDLSSNSIWSEDYDQFINFYDTKVPTDLFSASDDYDPLSYYDEEQSTYTKGDKITYCLTDYHMSLVSYKDDIYVPYAIIDCLTTSSLGYRFVWNGSAFYLAYPSLFYSDKQLTTYGKSYYKGTLATSARSQDFATYNYYSFLFEMRNFYGRYHALGTNDLDSELNKLGLKERIMSTDPATADAGIASAISSYFGDGGHTYFKDRGFGCKYDYNTDETLTRKVLTDDPRYGASYDVYSTLNTWRSRLGADGTGLFTKGSTAVIRFDDFSSTDGDGNIPTKESVGLDKTSTFGIFYNAFQKIGQDSSIKNVVFDVAMNGGGEVAALGHALSFMTDDPISACVKNYHTGATFKEVEYVDNDFDGDYKDNDSYAGKYNFYILTSGYSFSCANAFPCIAQEHGWAKIIGQKSGGGDCCVGAGCSADGTMYSISSNLSFIHEDGSSFDDGASPSPDYEIDYSNFYNLSYLDSFLSSLSA